MKTIRAIPKIEWARLGLVFVLALLLRLVLAYAYYSEFDIAAFNIPWAIAARDAPFGIYNLNPNLDYPPILPFLLSFLGSGMYTAQQAGDLPLLMLLVKLVPIVFDMALLLLLYYIGRATTGKGLLPAILWAASPAMLINVSLWGQVDSALLFFIVLMCWLLHEKRPVLACIAFALGCLCKLQMAYLIMALLPALVLTYKPKTWLAALGSGAGVGVLGWAPFVYASRELTLPLRIYFGGLGRYPTINESAANIYGFTDKTGLLDSAPLFGPLSYAAFGQILTVLALAVCVAVFILCCWRQKRPAPVAFIALFWMECVFMLSTRMHERYQLPVVALALLCYLLYQKRIFLWLHVALCLVSALNQGAVLFFENGIPFFVQHKSTLIAIASGVNLALFLVLCVVGGVAGYRYFRAKKAALPSGQPLSPK